MSRCLLANKYPWTAAFSSCQFTPTALRGTRVHVHVYIYIHTPGQNARACGSYVHLCAPLAAIEIMQSGGAREREREREWGLPWKQVKKKGKGKRKKGGETVGEMEKELDKLVRKKKWLHAATTRLRKFCNLSRRSVWKIFEGEEEIDGEEYFRKVKIFLDRLWI